MKDIIICICAAIFYTFTIVGAIVCGVYFSDVIEKIRRKRRKRNENQRYT